MATNEPIRPAGPSIGGPVAWAVRQFLVANREAEQALARRLGLGMNDVTALEHLLAASQGLGPAELAHRLGIRSASATVMVDRLEEAGHVSRTAHATDRRRTVVSPTAHARAEIMAALRPLVAAVDASADEFDEDERDLIVRFLGLAATRLRAGAAALADPSTGQGAAPAGDASGEPTWLHGPEHEGDANLA